MLSMTFIIEITIITTNVTIIMTMFLPSANCLSVGEELIFIGCGEGLVRCFSPHTLQVIYDDDGDDVTSFTLIIMIIMVMMVMWV